jgi:hypothetical protein
VEDQVSHPPRHPYSLDVAGDHPHGPGFGLSGVDPAAVWGKTRSVPVLFVGIGDPNWLASPEMRHPALVSRSRLRYTTRKSPWPKATVPWALDSGAFAAWSAGGWGTLTPAAWAEEVRHHANTITKLEFAAGMDWLVSDAALAATGKSVDYHLAATVENHCQLAALLDADSDPLIVPTVQGRTPHDYEHCLFRYLDAGVDLCRAPLVGAGTLTGPRRQWHELRALVGVLGEFGVTRVHGFGVHGPAKLSLLSPRLVSVDSSNWSRLGRHFVPLDDCSHNGKQEQNCLRFAMEWADEQLAEAHRDAAVLDTALAWVMEHHGQEPSDDDVAELDRRLDRFAVTGRRRRTRQRFTP